MKRTATVLDIAHKTVRKCMRHTFGVDDPLFITGLVTLEKNIKNVCKELMPPDGLMACLPLELLYMILDASPISSWCALANTCKKLLGLVNERAKEICVQLQFLRHKTGLGFLKTVMHILAPQPHNLDNYTMAEFMQRFGRSENLITAIVNLGSSCTMELLTALNMVPKFVLGSDSLFALDSGLLHWAAWNGNMPVLKFLVDEVGVTAQDFLLAGTETTYWGGVCTAMGMALGSGRLCTVQYLFEEVGLTASDIRSTHGSVKAIVDTADLWHNEAFQVLCNAGFDTETVKSEGEEKCAIIKYLVEKVQLTVDVDDFRNTHVLHDAVQSGHEDLVKTLFEHVGLTTEDARGCLRALFKGQLDMLKCLHVNTGLTADDFRTGIIFHGIQFRLWDEKMLDYLFKVVGLTIEDARVDNNELLRRAIRWCHFKIVKYLIENVLTVEDVRSVYPEAAGFARGERPRFDRIMVYIENVLRPPPG